LAALNLEGSLFVNNFELGNSPNGIYQPFYSTVELTRAKEQRHNDFAFADKESLLACVSLKDKCFSVFDTLLPPRQSQIFNVKSSNTGGSLMLLHQKSAYKAFTFNSKPGYYSQLDLRKLTSSLEEQKNSECVVKTAQISKEEITAVTFDDTQTNLIAGSADGLVRTFAVDENMTEVG